MGDKTATAEHPNRCEALIDNPDAGGPPSIRCPEPATHRRYDWRLCKAHAQRTAKGGWVLSQQRTP